LDSISETPLGHGSLQRLTSQLLQGRPRLPGHCPLFFVKVERFSLSARNSVARWASQVTHGHFSSSGRYALCSLLSPDQRSCRTNGCRGRIFTLSQVVIPRRAWAKWHAISRQRRGGFLILLPPRDIFKSRRSHFFPEPLFLFKLGVLDVRNLVPPVTLRDMPGCGIHYIRDEMMRNSV